MRIIVISDSHGNYKTVETVFLRNHDADKFIHLGDGEHELNDFLISHPEYTERVVHVAGNCDFGSLSPAFEIIEAEKHKILATHGHRCNVKSGLETIKNLALVNGCDIILFGHSHCRYNKYEDGFYILNPGSSSCPRDGNRPSFGHIDISDAGIAVNIADIQAIR